MLKIKVFLTAVFVLLSSVNVVASPQDITGTAYLLKERSTGRIIASYNPDMIIYPASTIKILTALVALDYINVDDVITVGTEIYYMPRGSSHAGHTYAEQISGINLIRGLLLRSGNDTSNIVAAHVARIITGEELPFPEAEKLFTDLMNEKARYIGTTVSNFTNAHGFHDPDMFVTAYELALISDFALNNEVIRQIASEITFEGNSADNMAGTTRTRELSWHTTNRLLAGEFEYPHTIGLKTGFHDQAGRCLVAAAQRQNISLISVVMGSVDPDRWTDTIRLFEYGFNNYSIRTIHNPNEPIISITIENPRWGDPYTIETFGTESFSFFLTAQEYDDIVRTIIYNDDIANIDEDGAVYFLAPLSYGDVIGTVTYTLDGVELFRDTIVLTENVLAWSVIYSIIYVIGLLRDDPFSIIGAAFLFGFGFTIIVLYQIVKICVTISRRRSRTRRFRQNKFRFK